MWVITRNVRRDSVDSSPVEKHIDRVKRPKLDIDSYREETNVPRTIVGDSKPRHWTLVLWEKIVRSIKFN